MPARAPRSRYNIWESMPTVVPAVVVSASPLFNSVGTIANGATDAVTVNAPTCNANDLLVVVINLDAGPAATITTYPALAGWTQIAATATGIRRGYIALYKVAAGGDSGAAFTFTGTTTGAISAPRALIARYTGNKTTGTIVEATAAASPSSTTTPAPGSITTSASFELAVAALSTFSGTSTVTVITGQSGGTWVESAAEQGAGGAGGGTIDFQHADMAAAGTISGGTATLGVGAICGFITFAILSS